MEPAATATPKERPCRATIDIADMKCWLCASLRNVGACPPFGSPSSSSHEAGVYDYVTELYDLLHLSSYERALDDIETYLTAKGYSLC